MQELEFNKSVQRNNNYQALRTKISKFQEKHL